MLFDDENILNCRKVFRSEAGDLMGVTSEIRRRFGDEVLGITVGLSNISKIRLKVSKEQAATFRDAEGARHNRSVCAGRRENRR